jgi:hypothetical protein
VCVSSTEGGASAPPSFLLEWFLMNNRLGLLRMLLMLGFLAILAAAFLLHRGFRATSTPTVAEAFFARKVRNFAIPHSERVAKNTLDASPDNLQQARSATLSDLPWPAFV